MPAKIKASTKEYIKDDKNRITSKWFWKHYTVASTSTLELRTMYKNPSYKKKKSMIVNELRKRNEEI